MPILQRADRKHATQSGARPKDPAAKSATREGSRESRPMVDGCAIHAWRIGRHVGRRRGRLDTGHSAGSTVGIRTTDLGASAEAFPKMRTFAMFERPGAILMAS